MSTIIATKPETTTMNCRHCGKRVSLNAQALRNHLWGCRPEMARAIHEEYAPRERSASALAREGFHGFDATAE